MKCCVVLLALLVGGCGKRQQVDPGVGSGIGSDTCTQLPFPPSVAVAEASGAAWVEMNGKPALLVISDSGHTGDYVIISAETGSTIEKGKLPLGPGHDGADDVEGIATRGGVLYGLTSSGWMRVWKRSGNGFELVDGPYEIGMPPFTCTLDDSNCGKNYEGLALAASAGGGSCAGFACSKEDGHLYCLSEKAGKLVLDPTRSIAVERKGVLADCAFSATGALYAGDNMFGNSTVYRIDGWADPASARVVEIGDLGVGFPEAIAVAGDVIYRMSDTGGAPSMMAKFRCVASGR